MKALLLKLVYRCVIQSTLNFMEVSEVIVIAREKSESMARLARIMARLKPLIYATNSFVKLRDDELTFYCQTIDAATKLAAALPAKLQLAYSGSSTTLTACIEIQRMAYYFEVQTIRQVRLDACELKRSRKRANGWSRAALTFNGMELVRLDYHDRATSQALKERLWKLLQQQKGTRHRLERFDFVL
jgi:hypothetical protein